MPSALEINNLPTPKEESWKYTNLPRAIPANLNAPDEADTIDIAVGKNEKATAPREIIFTGEDGAHHKPRLNITVEQGGELTLIETHDGDGAYWKNMVTTITLGENATLKHYRLQGETLTAVQTNMVHITLGRDAVYDGFTLNVGGKLTRHEMHAEIQGENATCTFNGVNLLGADQHGDTTILIEHQAPHCASNQLYRTVLDDNARGVFQGKVHVHQVAQKTDGYQLSNALLLSEKAEMDTKPELEIYADDVLCSHGATTGQLNEEPLFYLRNRGLTEAEARMLLIQAFVGEVVDKITDENFKSIIEEKTSAWLQTALSEKK